MSWSLRCDAAGLRAAGATIRSGGCVAFPTETVYGLGANALDAAAVLAIFRHKGRPLTDPLIVHVPTSAAAAAIVRFRGDDALEEGAAAALPHAPKLPAGGRRVFNVLAEVLWPGPLTLVARAAHNVPPAVTANTGLVGVRVPAHPIALALLRAAGVPVAAPSANRFGHVSPTSAAHVFADLGSCPIGILLGEGGGDEVVAAAAVTATPSPSLDGAGGGTPASPPPGAPTCAVGIESTVVRVDDEWAGAGSDGDATAAIGGSGSAGEHSAPTSIVSGRGGDEADSEAPPRPVGSAATVRLLIYRRGGVAPSALRAALDAAGLVSVPIHFAPPLAARAVAALDVAPPAALPADGLAPLVGDAAPGQLLTHYAPDIPAVLVVRGAGGAAAPAECGSDHSGVRDALSTSVIVDLGGVLAAHLRADVAAGATPASLGALAYRDLSRSGDAAEACRGVFDALRWAECVAGATRVLLADPQLLAPALSAGAIDAAHNDAWGALRDRLFRAASGRTVALDDVCSSSPRFQ